MAQDWTSVARKCKRCDDHGAGLEDLCTPCLDDLTERAESFGGTNEEIQARLNQYIAEVRQHAEAN